MNKLGLFLLLTGFTCFNTFGQTGYFGKKNSIEFRYNAAPTLKSKLVLKDANINEFVDDRPRIVNSSYALKFNRILSNKISVSAGLEFAGFTSVVSQITDFDVFEGVPGAFPLSTLFIEPNIRYRGVTLGLNFFGYFGINPLGIRGGVTLEYGSMVSDYSELTVYERAFKVNSNSLLTLDGTIEKVDFSKYESRRVNVTSLRWNLGRNFILSRKLLLKIDVSSNLLTFFPNQNYERDGIVDLLVNSVEFSYFSDKELDLVNNSFRDQEFNSFRRTYHSYRRLTLSLGISYAF